jgi:predicted MPP superfamily phosphohydrolase
LQARYGIYGCLGNHDFYARAQDELTTRLGARGIQIIRNGGLTVPIANSAVSILGIDDLRQGRSNLLRAMRSAANDPAEIRVLLSHRPEIFPRAAAEGIEVVLSGHYHGGQIKLVPGNDSPSIARLLTPYVEGLFRLPLANKGSERHGGEGFLFVGRGIGITALPVRLNCPPQIAHLTLTKA